MKEIILLGAGASVEAGVPAAYDMTKKLMDLFPETSKHGHIIRFVVGGMLMQKGVKGENPFDGVNVEDLFNAIELLANRESLEAAPFIGSWHRLVDELDLISPLPNLAVPAEYEDQGKLAIQYSRQSRRQKLYAATETRPGEGKAYKDLSEAMIRGLVKLIWVKRPQLVDYLQPILQIKSQSSLTIATLNYDNTVELAAKTMGVNLKNGILEWSNSGSLPKFDGCTCLLKLHGSIDWIFGPKQTPLSQERIWKIREGLLEGTSFIKPAIIFGHRNKLTAKGPFLDLLRSFEEQLHKADRLTIIGYSFRDDHINEQIKKWINHSAGKIRIINGENFHLTDSSFAKELIKLDKRVEVIASFAKDGIAECFS